MSEEGEMEDGIQIPQRFKSRETYKTLSKINQKKKEYTKIKNVLDELVDTSRMISNIKTFLIQKGYIRRRKLKKRMKKKCQEVSTQTYEIVTSYKFEPTHFAYFLDKISHDNTDGFVSVKVFSYILQDIMEQFRNSEDACLQIPEAWSNLSYQDLIILSCQIMVQYGTVNWKNFLMNCMDIPLPTQENLINALEQFQCLDVNDDLYIDKNKFDLVSLWFEPLEPDIIASDPKPLLWRECIFQLFKNEEGQMLYVDFLLFCCRDINPFIGITKALSIFVGYTLSTEGFPTNLMTEEEFDFTDSDMEILFTEDEEQCYYHRGSVVIPFIPSEGTFDRSEILLQRMINIKKRRQEPETSPQCPEELEPCVEDAVLVDEEEIESVPIENIPSEPETIIDDVTEEEAEDSNENETKSSSETTAITTLSNREHKSKSKNKKVDIVELKPQETELEVEYNDNEEEEEGEVEVEMDDTINLPTWTSSNLKISPETMLNVLWFGHICAYPFDSFEEQTKSYKKLKSLVDEMYEDLLRNPSTVKPGQSELVDLFQHQFMHQLLRRYRVFHEMDFNQLITEGKNDIPSDNINIGPLLESSEEEEETVPEKLVKESQIPGSPVSKTPSWYSNQSSTDEEEYYNTYYSKPKPFDIYKHFSSTGFNRKNPDDYIVTQDGEVLPTNPYQLKPAKIEIGNENIYEKESSEESECEISIKGFGLDLEMLKDFNGLLSIDKKERDAKIAGGFSSSGPGNRVEDSTFIKKSLMALHNKNEKTGDVAESSMK